MYTEKTSYPARSTCFYQWMHLPIALEHGHEMLTLYLLAKSLTDRARGGVVDLDIKAFSETLRSRPEFTVKRFETLVQHGVIYDPETHELFCEESLEQQLPAVNPDLAIFLHSVLDIVRNVESEVIQQAMFEWIKDAGLY